MSFEVCYTAAAATLFPAETPIKKEAERHDRRGNKFFRRFPEAFAGEERLAPLQCWYGQRSLS